MTASQPAPGHPSPSPRLAYDDEFATPSQMSADCRAAGEQLRLARAARAATRPAPSLSFDDFPREVHKRGEMEISEATARIAAAMNLQVDGDA